MIAGVAAVPTAPLLVPGVAGRLPGDVGRVARATTASLSGLAPVDVAVLVVAGAAGSVHLTGHAELGGIGRPDLEQRADVDPLARAVADRLSWPASHDDPLPDGLAVLVHLLGAAGLGRVPVVPVTAPSGAAGASLTAAGGALAALAVEADRRVAVVVAGDLSAGLGPRAPRPGVHGAQGWTEAAVDAVASGRLDRLTRMGPQEAARVAAVGWAPLVVLHGLCERARLATVLRHSAAPRGVGYLVASGG